ncbi:MAG: OmpA family protein [Bacteroidota bacterium]|nr:OmpA family protein [Bacteroidota bacterium]
MTRLLIFLCFFNFLSSQSYSQNYKKATKFYKEGNALYSIGDFDSAIDLFLKSLKSDPDFCPAIYKLGLSYKRINMFSDYKNWLLVYNDKLCQQNKDDVSYYLGEFYFLSGNISESKKHFDSIDDTLKFISLSKYRSNINYYINNTNNQLIYYIKNDSINRWYYQYSPYFDQNVNKLFFTVREGGNLFDDENIVTASLSDNNFTDFKPYITLNSENNEGTPSFSDDGKFMVFTSCEMDFKNNSCDIYYSQMKDNLWSKPRKFDDNVNSAFWDSQPFMYDGTLYFVSNRPGGVGGRDIYYSVIKEDGSFSKALNFREVNTKHEEVSPVVNDAIFYFSSNRDNSYGGYDIYLLDNNLIFNLGSSVNSYLDETSIFLWDDNLLLTVEDIMSNKKSQIIYGQISKKYEPLQVNKLVRTYDKETGEEIISDLFIIKDGERKRFSNQSKYNENFYTNSSIIAESKGYFPSVIEDLSGDTIDIFMNRLDENIILKNIYFDFDSYELSSDSKKYLSIISQWLGNNNFKEIQISGHADNVGSDEYNYSLSEARAEAVVKFILSIDPTIKNIYYKGFGNSVPIRPNYDGPENRRIEFKINN